METIITVELIKSTFSIYKPINLYKDYNYYNSRADKVNFQYKPACIELFIATVITEADKVSFSVNLEIFIKTIIVVVFSIWQCIA